jgi:ceramide glucosyltransferase
MAHHIFEILKILFALGTAASICYYCLCIWSAVAFLREEKKSDKSARSTKLLPPISILKPLKGTDPEMYENLRSHCLQDYPEYEIIFGVSEADDPALGLVQQLKQEFPKITIRMIVCEQKLGTNIKVSNLAQMARDARYDIFVISDSDIRVPPDYLARVVSPLTEKDVALVTCLYRGVPSGTLGSRLESLGISTDFIPGVLAARTIERSIRFGLGSTLAFRRQDLVAIGGFESFADYLADDYELGRRIAALGRAVKLSGVVVETFLPSYTMREFFQHQLRWSRTIRDARRLGHFGLILTFGLTWALITLAFSHGASWAWALLAAVFAMSIGVTFAVGREVLRDRQALAMTPLLPLRDILALLVWISSFCSRTVVWRGVRFHLKNGKLQELSG